MSGICAHLEVLGGGDTVQVQSWRMHLAGKHVLTTAQLQRLAEDTHRTACSALLRGSYSTLQALLRPGADPDKIIGGVRDYIRAARTVLSELVERSPSWGIVPPHKHSVAAHATVVSGLLNARPSSAQSASHVVLIWVERGAEEALRACSAAREKWSNAPLAFSLPPPEHMAGSCAQALRKAEQEVARVELEQIAALKKLLQSM